MTTDLNPGRNPSTMTGPIVFMDTETTGLDPEDHIWEWAALRRDPDGTLTGYHAFVQHDLVKAAALTDSFRADHDARYDPDNALTIPAFVNLLQQALVGRPHIIGAVPNFDTERLARILAHFDLAPMWHYHIKDVENVASGYLLGRASMGDEAALDALANLDDSDALSRACGVEPPTTERHTAMGDVRWAMALYDALHRPAVWARS
jgi:hypothetical protein